MSVDSCMLAVETPTPIPPGRKGLVGWEWHDGNRAGHAEADKLINFVPYSVIVAGSGFQEIAAVHHTPASLNAKDRVA